VEGLSSIPGVKDSLATSATQIEISVVKLLQLNIDPNWSSPWGVRVYSLLFTSGRLRGTSHVLDIVMRSGAAAEVEAEHGSRPDLCSWLGHGLTLLALFMRTMSV
jgi:hypothetical protein